jgi:hypothetical protein
MRRTSFDIIDARAMMAGCQHLALMAETNSQVQSLLP